jgi:hypothetical protein
MDPAYPNDRPAASRCFVAFPPAWGSEAGSVKRTYIRMYGFLGGLFALYAVIYVVTTMSPESEMRAGIELGVAFAFCIVVLLCYSAYASRYNRRRFHVYVTNDALTVDERPGDVFSVNSAKLGVWALVNGMTVGTALHLECGGQPGGQPFVLGGRDHRIGTGARLEAPPANTVDAWISASDFDELLTMTGPRSGLDVGGPAPGEPTRCLLFPNPQLAQQAGISAVREIVKASGQPRLAIDMGADAIRVLDANTNALVTSAAPAQVTATPETYTYQLWGHTGDGLPLPETPDESPVLVAQFPGMGPLSITCLDKADLAPLSYGVTPMDPRFSWPGNVRQRVNEPADYMVGGADWLTLVEKFGLAPYLERHREQG